MEPVSDDVRKMKMESTTKKKVCVVGAGMAGLTAARELRREGHAVTVMEQRGDVGGQWLYDPRVDAGDPLGAAAPVRVHSSMYASVRLLSPRECMGVSDFQFLPRHGVPGRDPRRFPDHHEVFFYLKEFCDAFRIMDMVRLNTKVVRVAMANQHSSSQVMRWQVRSVRVDPDSGEEVDDVEEEVFDAVVVANGHYSQPRLPTITGMREWQRRQLHSHSYRVPDTFRRQVVVLVGCSDSGMDIALDLCGVAKSVHLSANKSTIDHATTPPAMAKMLANHAGDLHLHPRIDRLCEDGTVEFADGARVVADAVIYCTGYRYSFQFLDTGGAVAVDEDGGRVGPLFEHTFPPAMAPLLSFVGIQKKLFVPLFFEAQGRWIARVLSGRSKLPPVSEMMRAVEEYHRAREDAGVPAKYAHDIGGVNPSEMYEFVVKYTDLPPREEWKRELTRAILRDINDDRETFRDLDNDNDIVRQGLQAWLCLSDDAPQQTAAAGPGAFGQV